jgi:cbb3-type cytochrome c oxidase subunit II
MLPGRLSRSGWQGVCLVAITYVYFLIFAQFAFLKRLSLLGVADAHLKTVMAAMAAGGILLSLLAPRLDRLYLPKPRMQIAFAVACMAAFLSLFRLSVAAAACVSLLIGAGLGLLTVTLVTHLRRWVGTSHPMLVTGLGTGLGYFICNVPPLFNAPQQTQAIVAGILCVAGIGISSLPQDDSAESPPQVFAAQVSFPRALATFTTLVWLDSAAFFIIQNTPALKTNTWNGNLHLWSNAVVHLAAALTGALLLSRHKVSLVLTLAFAFLGSACLLLSNSAFAQLASLFYPIGVSLYSVALVAYPSFIAGASTSLERSRIAGWIYAVAGWAGSAMGIGMGQNLGHVPGLFVLATAFVVLMPWAIKLCITRRREVMLMVVVLAAGFFLSRIIDPGKALAKQTQIERGRQVYISEGCIHCHSQFVRPVSEDVLMWGPASSIAEIRREKPPLIGNRRQGPDLAQIGLRRSTLWLKIHFFEPTQVSGASIMPKYGFLFRDERGDDLVAYLASLHGAGANAHLATEASWRISDDSLARADANKGERLYKRDCVTCHSTDGQTRVTWQGTFHELPVDLLHGPYLHLLHSDSQKERLIQLSRIVRFGIPGTDMAGHEYLSDDDVSSLALWLSHRIAQSNQGP